MSCTPFPADGMAQLADAQSLTIDINGRELGHLRAVPDAPRELAVGWAYGRGMIGRSCHITSSGLVNGRISLMVTGEVLVMSDPFRIEVPGRHGGRDIGIRPEETHIRNLAATFASASIDDGAVDGYVHAGLATRDGIQTIARDINPAAALAKTLGWAFEHDREHRTEIALISAMVDADIVRMCDRHAILTIVTPVSVTRDAVWLARILDITLVGMTSQAALVVFAGRLHEEPVVESDDP